VGARWKGRRGRIEKIRIYAEPSLQIEVDADLQKKRRGTIVQTKALGRK
jgi:hypothetical protein